MPVLPHCFALAALLISGFASTSPQAQAYPTKPVRLIVPSAAGSPADHIARWLGDRLAPVLVQSKARESMLVLGWESISNDTPAAFAAFIKVEYDKWGAVIRGANIKID